LVEYLKRIYDNDLSLIDPAIWELNFRSLEDAISKSVGDVTKLDFGSSDQVLATALRENAAVFSAFKAHQEKATLIKLLLDDAGVRRSWNDFKKLAGPITETYNKTWLETEYNQAVSNAEMAKKWDGFSENADLYPNLEYRAVDDGHARPDHLAMNGMVAPIDDPVWDTWYPPNDWGCRCSVTQTDKPVAMVAVARIVAKRIAPNTSAGFDFNPGKDKKLFAESAGYFNQDKKTSKAVNKEASTLLKNLDA